MSRSTRLETEAVILGYAMSRLDSEYLALRGLSSWKAAFLEASSALGRAEASFKNLRDEFDPIHSNKRSGWNRRPMRPNRLQVASDLCETSDEALISLVAGIIGRDESTIVEVVDSLAASRPVAHNVAERLLAGRRAEDLFLDNCGGIVAIERPDIEDFRQAARGFDFGVRPRPEIAIEVKGMKEIRGEVLFTDREWSEAEIRGEDYWLVVVGNLARDPIARVLRNPREGLDARCTYRQSVTASWRSTISVG